MLRVISGELHNNTSDTRVYKGPNAPTITYFLIAHRCLIKKKRAINQIV